MKEIKAILQPHALARVMDALHALPHFPGVTVSDWQGRGRENGLPEPATEVATSIQNVGRSLSRCFEDLAE